jgi:hypothetical protein
MRRRTDVRVSPPQPANGAVQAELEAIDRAFERVSKTRKSALSFLKKAGIVDSQGRLAKAYR